ncbi:DBH-like monooxygenase protein 1 homolog [Osmerus eperlanus]|uniref:DBH-like monooxygenase protein 1 homolog n=1 Tax=Osmerus eperlanus TaxID=29151 RepID=UPI002E0D7479
MFTTKYCRTLVCFWFYATLSRGSGFQHSTVLDPHGKYHLKWSFNRETISFEVEVETTGYVGFGLSPNGAMASSDIVIGGVVDGTPYLQDYHADSNRKVHLDELQSYRLESGWENSTHTRLGFSRDLLTCDTKDKDITESTVRVIWAYHSDDVGPSGPVYHGLNRGRKSLRLLTPAATHTSTTGSQFFDLKNRQVAVPSRDTTYWCQMFRIPETPSKHHITQVQPMIQPGHENLVHHILLYQCDSNLSEEELEHGHECYHPNMPDSFNTCQAIFFAWAIGGEGFTYPPHVGLSIGTATDPVYVLMETHYDNPGLLSGLQDSSGLRFYHSATLREFDAGVLETGMWVSLYHMLPPGMEDYTSQGHCTNQCLQEALGEEMPGGVRVFAVLMHAHLAGRAITTRHFRDNQELPPLSHDAEFDFNFQEFQLLEEETPVLPTDSLITECKYNTAGRRNVTWGGLSTREEMCLSYLLYYPRVNLSRCESLPLIMGQLNFIGVRDIQPTWPFLVKSPKRYSNMTVTAALETFRWTRRRGQAFNQLVLQLPINIRCSKLGMENWGIQGSVVTPPEVHSLASPPSTPCSTATPPQGRAVLHSTLLLISLVLLHLAL